MQTSFFLSNQEISLPVNFSLFFIFFFLNFFIPIYISKKFKVNLHIPIVLVCLNLLVYILFLIFEENASSDGISFFSEKLINETYPFYIRDNFIIKLSLIFKDLKIHYLIVTLFTNILSGVSFLLIYIKFRKYKVINNFYYFIIFFIICNSGMLFWANGLLKENFILFAITLFLFSINSNKINFKLLIASIVICFLIRPLIGFFIILSMIIFYNIYFAFKKNFWALSMINLLIMFPMIVIFQFISNQYGLVLDFTFLEQLINEIKSYSLSYQDPNYKDNLLTYDTSQMYFFEKYFVYYFGPLLPLSPIFVLISIQNSANLLILIFFIYYVFKDFKKFVYFIKISKFQSVLFLYCILYTLIVPLTCFNYGIAFRQKWMCLIILIYLMLSFISYCRKKI
tara:strand:+ start:384 stop:1574 length:1191 start_codon:yes stop_codon:yes gene_type:complete